MQVRQVKAVVPQLLVVQHDGPVLKDVWPERQAVRRVKVWKAPVHKSVFKPVVP